MEVSNHAFNRINERFKPVQSMREAERIAEQAYKYGYTADYLRSDFKHLASYLDFKKQGESERTEIRLYKECLWLWNGRRKVLRTVYPIYKLIPNATDLKKLRKREKENGCNEQNARAL